MAKISCRNKILLSLLSFRFLLAGMDDHKILLSTDERGDSDKQLSLDFKKSCSLENQPGESHGDFYKEYIAKYYPKAYVIQEKFLSMNVDQVAEALKDTTYVFAKKPWFYFQNTPKRFKLIYFWEYVIDQLYILHDFLIKARVERKTKKIFLPETMSKYNFWNNFSSYSADKKSILLADYLKDNYVNVYADFYALSYDYHVKMFNEGILLKKMAQANRYMSEINYISDMLRGTPREADYENSTKTCKRVLDLLRKILNKNNYLNSSQMASMRKAG